MERIPSFWTLMEKSTITSGVIAIMVVAIMGYCAIYGIAVPDYMIMTLGAIIAFFFISKAKDGDMREANRRMDRIENGHK